MKYTFIIETTVVIDSKELNNVTDTDSARLLALSGWGVEIDSDIILKEVSE